MAKMPKEIIVYQCDTVEGMSIYAVARNVDEIPEDVHGDTVGVYMLSRKSKFRLKRELIDE